MKKYRFLLTIINLIVFLIVSCSTVDNSLSQDDGGSTETIGMLYSIEGKPVSGATVLFIPEEYIPQDQEDLIDTTKTDDKGRFTFDNIPDGNYNISYNKSNVYAFRKSIEIKEGKSNIIISDTLKDPGEIHGFVNLLPEHDNREVYILILGTERFTIPVDSCGNFKLLNLAEGIYDLKFITTYNNYQVVDSTVKVFSSEIFTFSDTIKIPFIGISTPSNFSVNYDTLTQRAKFNWDNVINDSLAGYLLYRKEGNDSTYNLVTTDVIANNFYIDSCDGYEINQGSNWSYKVCGVDKNGIAGACSTPLIISYTSAFNYDEPININNLQNITKGSICKINDNKLLVVSSEKSSVYEIQNDSIFNIIEIPNNSTPYDIKLMSDSTILVSTIDGVYNLDRDGKQLYWYNIISTQIESDSSRYIYYTTSSDFWLAENTLCKFDTYKGIVDTLLVDKEQTIISFSLKNNYIYLLSDRNGYMTLSKNSFNDNKKEIIKTDIRNSGFSDMAISDNQISILADKKLQNISLVSGELLNQTTVNNRVLGITNIDNNCYTLLLSDGSIQNIKKRY